MQLMQQFAHKRDKNTSSRQFGYLQLSSSKQNMFKFYTQ